MPRREMALLGNAPGSYCTEVTTRKGFGGAGRLKYTAAMSAMSSRQAARCATSVFAVGNTRKKPAFCFQTYY